MTIASTSDRLRLPVQLSPQTEVALLARILYREGWSDYNAGHVTYRQRDDTYLVLPSEFGWNEAKTSDVLRIDVDGNKLEGEWSVTPSIQLHLEFHKQRPGCAVTVHQHPKFATIYSAVGKIPPAYDQRSANVPDADIVFYDDYKGGVSSESAAKAAVVAIGDRNCALLRNHGVFVVGDSIPQALTRAIALEWRCKQAWYVEAIGGGKIMPEEGQEAITRALGSMSDVVPNLWEWAVRREVRLDAEVLE